jgi:hypothetical protein
VVIAALAPHLVVNVTTNVFLTFGIGGIQYTLTRRGGPGWVPELRGEFSAGLGGWF